MLGDRGRQILREELLNFGIVLFERLHLHGIPSSSADDVAQAMSAKSVHLCRHPDRLRDKSAGDQVAC